MKLSRRIFIALCAGGFAALAQASNTNSPTEPSDELNGFPQPPPTTYRSNDTIRPDESWIGNVPPSALLVPMASLHEAWTAQSKAGAVVRQVLPDMDTSLFFQTTPEQIWTRLAGMRGGGPLQIAATVKGQSVPGGYGLDPLPARSVYGAALLFGVGGADTGVGSYQHQRMVDLLEKIGAFDQGAKFLPFWSQARFYQERATGGLTGPDYNALFAGKPDAPLFGHTAPGVLVSGYKTKGKLLLVIVNYTNQAMGKLGDIWVDVSRLFPGKPSSMQAKMAANLRVTNPETGIQLTASFNRANGSNSYIDNYFFNVAIAPGDFGMILLETNP